MKKIKILVLLLAMPLFCISQNSNPKEIYIRCGYSLLREFSVWYQPENSDQFYSFGINHGINFFGIPNTGFNKVLLTEEVENNYKRRGIIFRFGEDFSNRFRPAIHYRLDYGSDLRGGVKNEYVIPPGGNRHDSSVKQSIGVELIFDTARPEGGEGLYFSIGGGRGFDYRFFDYSDRFGNYFKGSFWNKTYFMTVDLGFTIYFSKMKQAK